MERTGARDRGLIEQPRCPFCHEGIEAGAEQLACNQCRAWHHQDCWREGEGCSACRSRSTGLEASESPPLRAGAIFKTGLLLAMNFVIGAAFAFVAALFLKGLDGAVDVILPGGAAGVVIATVILFVQPKSRAREVFSRRPDQEKP